MVIINVAWIITINILYERYIERKVSVFVLFIILVDAVEAELVVVFINLESALIDIVLATDRCSSEYSLLAEVVLIELYRLSVCYVITIFFRLSRVSYLFPSLAAIEAVFHLSDVICAVRLKEYRKLRTSLRAFMRNSSDQRLTLSLIREIHLIVKLLASIPVGHFYSVLPELRVWNHDLGAIFLNEFNLYAR